jgi:fermentation-respiration switch protein FrsA (DUF1100 family)
MSEDHSAAHVHDHWVSSGRDAPVMVAATVLATGLLAGAAVATALQDSPWPILLAVAVLAALTARPALYQWRHRRELAALRRARRRVKAACKAWELHSMAGKTPVVLERLVVAQCKAADTQRRSLLIEVGENDAMVAVWMGLGFKSVEQVQTPWGRVELLVRRPR